MMFCNKIYELVYPVDFIILTHQIEKSDVLPWVSDKFVYHKAHVLSLKICCIRCVTSLSEQQPQISQDGGGKYRVFKVTMHLFKCWHPKVCKKKNRT